MIILSMMVIGLMAVIAIAFIAAAIWLFLKRRGGGQSNISMPNSMLDSVSRPKTLAQQQSTAPSSLNTAPVMPTAEPVDYLAKAEKLMQQNDFNGAIDVLKTGIKQSPNRGDLQIQLLNAFAQAQDYKNFEQFYPVVLRLNDPAITNQANNLKNLIDEELAAIAAQELASKANAKVEEDKPLDFDFDFSTDSSNTVSEPTTQSPTSDEQITDELSFDDFNFDTQNASQTDVSTAELETLSFDDFDSVAPVETTNQTNNTVEEMDFDFSFDTEKSNAQSTPTATNDTDDFDFGLELTDDTSVSAPIQQDTVADLDFDLSLDDQNIQPSSHVQAAETEFDFNDLSLDDTSKQETVTSTTENNDDLLVFDLALDNHAETTEALVQDDVNFELDVASTVNDTSETLEAFTFDEPTIDSEVDFTLDTTSPTIETSKADEVLFDDNFGIENDIEIQTPTAELKHTDDELLFDDHTGLDVITETPPTSSPVSADSQQLINGFEFIKSLDNSQLTLDLAEQYIDLGEYDSAKRLLEELQATAPTLQSKVAVLLERIS